MRGSGAAKVAYSHLANPPLVATVTCKHTDTTTRTTIRSNGFLNHLTSISPLGETGDTLSHSNWSDNTPVAGQQFDCAFDDIGNRQTATRDGRQATYSPNSLNQYTSRTGPGYVNVLGTATNDATGRLILSVTSKPATARRLAFDSRSRPDGAGLRAVGAR